jgi:hypothetical protein
LVTRNVTLSVDEELLRKAREFAHRRNASLNDLFRQYLESLVGADSGRATADELLELMESHGGRSGGRRIGRDEAYEGRL